MNEPLLTTALLLIVACNLGVLWLYFWIDRWMQTPNDVYGLLVYIKAQLKGGSDANSKLHD